MSDREQQSVVQEVQGVFVESYVVVDEYIIEPEMLCVADMRVDVVEECEVELNELRDLETVRRQLE